MPAPDDPEWIGDLDNASWVADSPTGNYWVAAWRPGGWVRLDAPSGLPNGFKGHVYVHLKPWAPLGGRLLVARVVVSGAVPISARTLRQVPIADVEALAANPEVEHVLRQPFSTPLPTVESLGRHFEETKNDYPDYEWVPFVGTTPMVFTDVPVVEGPVKAPKGRITEEFLNTVAAAYARATAEGVAPGPAIAKQADVPVRTVHGWIAQARKRGILPPARRGRAG